MKRLLEEATTSSVCHTPQRTGFGAKLQKTPFKDATNRPTTSSRLNDALDAAGLSLQFYKLELSRKLDFDGPDELDVTTADATHPAHLNEGFTIDNEQSDMELPIDLCPAASTQLHEVSTMEVVPTVAEPTENALRVGGGQLDDEDTETLHLEDDSEPTANDPLQAARNTCQAQAMCQNAEDTRLAAIKTFNMDSWHQTQRPGPAQVAVCTPFPMALGSQDSQVPEDFFPPVKRLRRVELDELDHAFEKMSDVGNGAPPGPRRCYCLACADPNEFYILNADEQSMNRRQSKLMAVKHLMEAAVLLLGLEDIYNNFEILKHHDVFKIAMGLKRKKKQAAETSRKRKAPEQKEKIRGIIPASRRFGFVAKSVKKYFCTAYFTAMDDRVCSTKLFGTRENLHNIKPTWTTAAFLALSPTREGGFREPLVVEDFVRDCIVCFKTFLLIGENPASVEEYCKQYRNKAQSKDTKEAIKQQIAAMQEWRKRAGHAVLEVPENIYATTTSDMEKAQKLIQWVFTAQRYAALRQELASMVHQLQTTARAPISAEWEEYITPFRVIEEYRDSPTL